MKTMATNATSTRNILQTATFGTLQTMTRNELRTLAKRIGIKVGKTRQDTISNLNLAQAAGVMHAKVKVEFCPKPENPDDYRIPVFGKKFSNGKAPKVFRTIV